MNYSKLAEQFWDDGYLVIDHFFSTPLMDHLNDVILDHFGVNPKWEHSADFLHKSQTEVIPWFPYRESNHEFDPVETDNRLRELTTAILGDEWKGLYLMVMYSTKGTKGQAWHQDCPPENRNEFNLNRLIYTHDLNDLTGGKTVILPGSHKMGEISRGDPHGDIVGQITLSPKKGTLVLIHGQAWHRVHPIKGDYRCSTNSRVIPGQTSEDITDIAVYRNIRYRFSTNEVIEERSK